MAVLSRAAISGRLRRTLGGWTPSVIVLAILVAAIGLPVLTLFQAAFLTDVPTASDSHYTLANLRRVYASLEFWDPLRHTLYLAASVSMAATVLGTVLAFVYIMADPHAKRLIRGGLMAPLFVSPVIGVIAWQTLAQPGAGLLNRALSSLHLPTVNVISVPGAMFVMTIGFTPIVFVLASEALDRIGAEVYEAASVIGAQPWTVLNRITLRLLAPASLTSFLLVFVLASEMYSVPSLLAAPKGYYVLSNVIFTQMTGFPLDYPGAAAASTLLFLIVVLGVLANSLLTRRRERFVAVTGKGARRPAPRRSRRTRAITTAFLCLYISITLLLPLGAVVARSFMPFFAGGSQWKRFDLDNYRTVLDEPSVTTAINNSVRLALGSIVVAILLGGAVGYLTIRRRGWLSRGITFLANIPLGFPGTIFAVGLIWVFIGTPVYKSVYIVALAIFAGWMPIVVRVLQVSVLQSSAELEDAARVSGAAPIWMLARVVFPLLRTSLFMGATLAVVFTFNEVSGAAILVSGRNMTLSVLAFQYIQDGQSGYAAVVALMQIGLIALFAALLLAAAGRNQRVSLGQRAVPTEPEPSLALAGQSS